MYVVAAVINVLYLKYPSPSNLLRSSIIIKSGLTVVRLK